MDHHDRHATNASQAVPAGTTEMILEIWAGGGAGGGQTGGSQRGPEAAGAIRMALLRRDDGFHAQHHDRRGWCCIDGSYGRNGGTTSVVAPTSARLPRPAALARRRAQVRAVRRFRRNEYDVFHSRRRMA